ncbi:hypothetical protein KBC79_03570, partial [Candidatus Woesebacteria bacterium]|nr:hypothetical protein [Candidatus Woesebacteria bacterium]
MSENDVTFHEPMPGVNSGEIDGLYSKNWLNYSDPSSQRTYFSDPPEQAGAVHYSRTKRAIYGALAAAVLALQLSGPFSASESALVIPADEATSDNSDPSSTRIEVHPVEPIPDSEYLYPIPNPDEVIATNAAIPEHVLFMPVVQEPKQDLLSQIEESLATIGITTETLTDLRPQHDESEAQLRKLAVIFEKLAENWRRFEAILAPHGDTPSNKQHFNEISIREAIDTCSTRVGLITRTVTIPSSAPQDDDCFSAEAYHIYQQHMNM